MKKTVEKYYDSFNSKDYQAMLDLLSDDVVHEINQGEVEVGKDLFRIFLDVMDKHYDEELKDIVIMGDGRNCAAEFTCYGKYKNTAEGLPKAHGQSYCVKVGAFFELKDGVITRITNYYNLKDWIKQVSK